MDNFTSRHFFVAPWTIFQQIFDFRTLSISCRSSISNNSSSSGGGSGSFRFFKFTTYLHICDMFA